MDLRKITGQNFSDDAEFDDIDDFDYTDGFIRQEEELDEHELLEENIEEIDNLDDLYVDDDEEDELDDNLMVAEDDIHVSLVCEECGHKWEEMISEEEHEGELQRSCPLCGSRDLSLVG